MFAHSAIMSSVLSNENQLSPYDLKYEYGYSTFSLNSTSTKSILLPTDQSLLYSQKLVVNPLGKMTIETKSSSLKILTPLIEKISVIMGIYYFLWILLGSNLMMDYSTHAVYVNQIDRFEASKDRKPNFYLSFICCCGSTRT